MRLSPDGLNFVARMRFEYPPATLVPFAQIGHCEFDAINVWAKYGFRGLHAIMRQLYMQGADPIDMIFGILVLIFSIVAHEVSHGYAALALGDKTALYAGRLTMNPLKHIDPVGSILVPVLTILAGAGFGWAKPVPYNPANLRDKKWGDTKVALAGPFTNFGIALLFALVVRFGADTFSPEVLKLTLVIVFVNIVLGVFNMIPVPPFDGSKILHNLLPYRYQYIYEYMERYWLFVLLFVVLFVWEFLSPLVDIIFRLMVGG